MICGYTFTLFTLMSHMAVVFIIINHTVTSLPLSRLLYILLTRSSASRNNNFKKNIRPFSPTRRQFPACSQWITTANIRDLCVCSPCPYLRISSQKAVGKQLFLFIIKAALTGEFSCVKMTSRCDPHRGTPWSNHHIYMCRNANALFTLRLSEIALTQHRFADERLGFAF